MLTKTSLIDQLVMMHYAYETWHDYVDPLDVRGYFEELNDRGNIVYDEVDGELTGYIEFWRINYAKFGYLMLTNNFNVREWDTTRGNIVFVANMTIVPEHRGTDVINRLRDKLFARIKDYEMLCGFRHKRLKKPVIVHGGDYEF